MLDKLITGGMIVDGSGKPGVRKDLGILGDTICFIGNATEDMIKEAGEVIRADGMVVSPGFIDCHTHSDLSLFTSPEAASRLYGGVTTEIAGNCGVGVAPVVDATLEDLKKYFYSICPGKNPLDRPVFAWHSFGEYLETLDRYPAAINMGSLVAQGAIRIAVMGFEKGAADTEQILKMQALTKEAMESGAFGVSTGLNYLPGAFCDAKELAEVTKPAEKHKGLYVSHIRTQSEGIFESVDEAVRIAKDAGVGLHISHLKLLGSPVWGKTEELFERIEKARGEGLPVSFDAYPYEAGATGLTALLPHWSMEGGIPALMERLSDRRIRETIQKDCIEGIPGWQAMIKTVGFGHITLSDVAGEANRHFLGKTLEEIASLRGQSEFDTLFDLLLEEEGHASMVISHMSPEDVDAILSHPDCMIASDSQSMASGRPHPRYYGTNGRVFKTYVREKKLFTLEDAVRKMTSLPAKTFGIEKRGELREGYFADVVVFDPETIGDRATYNDPERYSTGMKAVIVNGQTVFDGVPTGALAGKVLRHF